VNHVLKVTNIPKRVPAGGYFFRPETLTNVKITFSIFNQ